MYSNFQYPQWKWKNHVAVNEVKVGEFSVGIERNGFCVPHSLEKWETHRSAKRVKWEAGT